MKHFAFLLVLALGIVACSDPQGPTGATGRARTPRRTGANKANKPMAP